MDEATHKKNFKPIVLKDLFLDKSPSAARWIPGFVYRYLSRILQINFINESMLYEHGYKKDVEFARASLKVLNVSVEAVGRDNLPPQGRFIFASNHPLGGFDGMMVISELHKTYLHLKVLVNDILTSAKNMDGIFVPINKHGAQAMENVRRINEIFASDEQVVSFPAGLVSRRKKGVIRDPEWQKSIIAKARQSKRDIIPIHVSGRNSNFFYNLSNIRKFLRIKTNLEMFFLPNESYKHHDKHFVLTFGKAIPFETFDKRYNPKKWAQLVREHVYDIADEPQKRFKYIQS